MRWSAIATPGGAATSPLPARMTSDWGTFAFVKIGANHARLRTSMDVESGKTREEALAAIEEAVAIRRQLA